MMVVVLHFITLIFLIFSPADYCDPFIVEVRGTSMYPEYLNGDQINIVRAECKKPMRGDVIIFKTPSYNAPILKRLVGLPGDILEVGNGGLLSINGNIQRDLHGNNYIVSDRYKLKNLNAVSGIIPGYFVLGNIGSLDSTQILFINKKNILGIVQDQVVLQEIGN